MGRRLLLSAAVTLFGVWSFVQAQFLSPLQSISNGTGLRTPWAIATDPQGRNLYVASVRALAVLSRDAQTGSIASLEAHWWGIGDLPRFVRAHRSVTVSPEGANVYAAGNGLAAFRRDPASGRLEFLEAHRFDPQGGFIALNQSTSVLVSPDGAHLYVGTEDLIVVYERNPTDGRLTFVDSQQNGVGNITLPAGVQSLASDRQGTHVYLTSEGDRCLAAYSRDASTGLLTLLGECQFLPGPSSVTISPEGAYVYVCSLGPPFGLTPGQVTVFSRAADGTLTFVEEHIGELFGNFDGATDLRLSPDASHLYVTSEFANLTVFRRNPDDGTLTRLETLADGAGGVDGLGGASSVVVSPDGAHLYATGRSDNAVAAFQLEAEGGSLEFSQALFDGDGAAAGLFQASAVAVSPDGMHVYAASDTDHSLAVFLREAPTGSLAFVESYFDGEGGVQGLVGARSLALSPDGSHLYVAASDRRASPGEEPSSSLAAFRRDPATGSLSFLEAHFDRDDPAQGLLGARSVRLSPDGNHLYLAASFEFFGSSALAVFQRDPASGRLSFLEAQFDQDDGVDGLEEFKAVAVSPDGAHVYAVSETDISSTLKAISIFGRDSATGRLSFLRATIESSVDGDIAELAFSSDGVHLYIASGILSTFRRDASSGFLTLVNTHGIQGARSVAVNPHGTQIYAASGEDDAISAFERDDVTGFLRFVEAHVDSNPGSPNGGLERTAGSTAVSPDGANLYVAGLDGDLTAFSILNPLEFPQFGNGEGLTSEIVLVNPNAQASSGRLEFFDQSGQPFQPQLLPPAAAPRGDLQNAQSFTIPPLGSVRFMTDGAGELRQGSARVVSDRPLNGVICFEIEGRGTAGVPAAPITPIVAYVPVQKAAGINTGIALRSVKGEATVAELILRDLQGEEVPGGRANIDLPPDGRVSRFIDEFFPEAETQGFQGSVSIEGSSGSIVGALALELGQPGEFTTLPVAPRASISDGSLLELHFAQFGNGEGFSSELVVTNLSFLVEGEVAFFDESGTPIDLRPRLILPETVDSSTPLIRFSLEERGSTLRLATDGQGPLQAGSALIRSDRPLSGVVRFRMD